MRRHRLLAGRFLAAAVVVVALVQRLQQIRPGGQDLVVDGDRAGVLSASPARRGADVEHADQLVEIGMQRQLVLVAVGALQRIAVGVVGDVAQAVAEHALRDGFAEVGAEAVVHHADILERIALDRPAAQHQEAAALHELVRDPPDQLAHIVEREALAGDVVDAEAGFADRAQRPLEGRDMTRLKVDREIVLALEVDRLPGAGMIDAVA